MSRKEARYASGEMIAPTTAIISITDVGSEHNEFYPASWIEAVVTAFQQTKDTFQIGLVTNMYYGY
jgi:hypothetical protein